MLIIYFQLGREHDTDTFGGSASSERGLGAETAPCSAQGEGQDAAGEGLDAAGEGLDGAEQGLDAARNGSLSAEQLLGPAVDSELHVGLDKAGIGAEGLWGSPGGEQGLRGRR